jgi:hypothetical protein
MTALHTSFYPLKYFSQDLRKSDEKYILKIDKIKVPIHVMLKIVPLKIGI